MIRRNRYHCPMCPADVQSKSAALPWVFRRPVHGSDYQDTTGEALPVVLGARGMATAEAPAKVGATVLDAWVQGLGLGDLGPIEILALLTTRHRRASPPSLSEQPRMSLETRRDYHEFLTTPIIRQALTVALLQNLVNHHETCSVPNQNLQPVAAFRTEHDRHPGMRIQLQLGLHDQRQRPMAAAEVHRTRRGQDRQALPRSWRPPAGQGPPGAPDAANPKADARPHHAAARHPPPEHRAESSPPQSGLSPRPASADIHASAAQPRRSHQIRPRHLPSPSPSECSERDSPQDQRPGTAEINGTGTAHTPERELAFSSWVHPIVQLECTLKPI